MIIKDIWRAISRFGLDALDFDLDSDTMKKVLITNRVAIIIGSLTFLFFIFDLTHILISGESVSILNTARPLFVTIMTLVSLLLNNKKCYTLAKINLIFSTLFILLFFPIFIDKINSELLLFVPLITISISILNLILFNLKTEKIAYWVSMIVTLTVFLFGENIIVMFSDEMILFHYILSENLFTYTIFKLAIFAFVNLILIFMWDLSFKYETRLEDTQHQLLAMNDTLSHSREELEVRNDELTKQYEEITIQRDLIIEQNERIKSQNKDIFRSIAYAKRIQDAMIPKTSPIKEFVRDSFVMFKPKELISGDFHWSLKIDKQVIVAVSDCTGHGVPGAFLSMLGISILNDIVGSQKLTKADEILNALRNKIIDSLSQKNEELESKDGMDMALCVFDFEKFTVEYAGAFNPLILIREGKMIEYQADRMPIGIHDNASIPFSARRIPLKKGDRFFMFTDGYQDQFGGLEGKKFMAKQLRNLLLSTSCISLNDQYTKLENTFEDWKGFNEQVDDVLLVGIEI